ncbi:MAG: aminotransferase class V-fold PLP-dependent enzyme [Verrucomicrobia bacterium]|nr:aminotransferase class V-fold PLP-dependent enzyme [Verrucomicrobiota bacterium]
MTISELHSNEELRHYEFPVTREKIFLAHGGVCPLPRRVSESIRHYAALCMLGDQETLLPATNMRETRALAARLLGAQSDEIAFVGPTSLALSYVASGLSFRKHEHILIYFDDYPSNVYPWLALAERGVKVRLLNVRDLGRVRLVDIKGQVDENTRLVALASAHFVSGFRIELDAIGKYLHERNILFCVDAIQTLGAFPTSIANLDFLAADAHKWLLGPCAAGIMYVRKNLQDKLRPPIFGWHNVRCPDYVAQEEIVLRTDARRYEVGTQNWLGLVGLHAALELLLEIGIDNIARELARKRAWLVPALKARGCVVLNGDAPAVHSSGITAFHHSTNDAAAIYEKLTAANITTSLRTDRAGQRYIRLSPHFYNTDRELERLLELL